MFNTRTLRLPLLSLYLTISFNAGKAEDINKLISKICLQGFINEMHLAGKKPKVHIGKFACDCFIDKVASGSNIESAQELCREETSKKFNL